MLENINFSENDIVVDCGANIGEIYCLIKQINGKNYNFDYFGFEPSEFEFNILDKNSNNNVQEPLALFNQDTKKNFYLNRELADSSLIKNDKLLVLYYYTINFNLATGYIHQAVIFQVYSYPYHIYYSLFHL